MKYLSTFMLGLLLSPFLFASTGSGDINFIFEHNPSHQGYKFRLIINNNAITSPTACISSNDDLPQILSYGSIGESEARLNLQASDCSNTQDQWYTLNGYLDYDSNYWYNLYIDMITHSFHT